jgi:hypothetical protein
MITSIEPGLYRPGRWGVRIENLVLNVEAPADEFGEFLAFETLTLCPIDTRCIERALLGEDEAPGSTATTPWCASAVAAHGGRGARLARARTQPL